MTTTSTDAAGWEPLPSMPEPGGGGLCGAVGSRIVIVGGTNWEGGTKNWLRSVHEYEPKRRMWTKRPNLENGPVAYGITIQDAGRFRFLGGSDGTKPLKTLATVDATNVTVRSVPELPAALVLAAGGEVDRRFVIVGGTDDAANVAGVQRTTHVAEPTGDRWKVTRMADFPGEAIAVAASAAVGDELFVFGGMHWDATTAAVVNLKSAYAFSPRRNSWRKLKPLAVATRGLCGVPLDGRHIYLAGGFAEDFSAAAVLYDIKNDSYRPAMPLPHAAMVSLVRCGDFLYCLGGEDKMKSRTDKCFRISVAQLLGNDFRFWAGAGPDADGVDWERAFRHRNGRPLDGNERARIAKLGTLPIESLVAIAGYLMHSTDSEDLCVAIGETISNVPRWQYYFRSVLLEQIRVPTPRAIFGDDFMNGRIPFTDATRESYPKALNAVRNARLQLRDYMYVLGNVRHPDAVAIIAPYLFVDTPQESLENSVGDVSDFANGALLRWGIENQETDAQWRKWWMENAHKYGGDPNERPWVQDGIVTIPTLVPREKSEVSDRGLMLAVVAYGIIGTATLVWVIRRLRRADESIVERTETVT